MNNEDQDSQKLKNLKEVILAQLQEYYDKGYSEGWEKGYSEGYGNGVDQ